MTCTRLAELLPWLVNGSLGADDTETMLAHLRGCPGCRAELEAARGAWEIYGAHVPVAALVDYAFGETPAGLSRGEVATHLAACPACRMELDLVRQVEADEQATAVALPSTPVRLSDRADRSERLAGSMPAPAIPRRWQARRLALAAACAVAVVGAFALGRWQSGAQRTQTVVASGSPAADFATLELWPGGRVERGSALPRTPAIPAIRASVAALITLRTDDVTPFAGFALEIHDSAGAVLWRSESVTRQPAGEFVLELPAGALPPGELQIRLLGRAGDHWSEIERYALRLDPADH